jgi:arginase
MPKLQPAPAPHQRCVHIIGYPMDLGAGRRGVDMGPSALRNACIGEQLQALGYRVKDEGNLLIREPEVEDIGDPQLRYAPAILKASRELARLVAGALDGGGIPLVLGGDHSLGIGSIAGAALHCRKARKRLGVLWIDAHGDINTPQTTPSGNIHGMPVAVSLGLGDARLTRIGGFAPKLELARLAYIALRDLDPGEQELIRNRGVKHYSMRHLDESGGTTAIKESLRYLEDCDHLHVSFDADALDPGAAPGVGTPVNGGLTFREAHMMMEEVAEAGRLGSMDLAEVNPTLDLRNQTAEVMASLALTALGKRII